MKTVIILLIITILLLGIIFGVSIFMPSMVVTGVNRRVYMISAWVLCILTGILAASIVFRINFGVVGM